MITLSGNTMFAITCIIVVFIAYLSRNLHLPKENSKVLVFKTDTISSSTERRLLLAIVGHIFDVSRGAKFYGPGGGYSRLVGRDCSRFYATGFKKFTYQNRIVLTFNFRLSYIPRRIFYGWTRRKYWQFYSRSVQGPEWVAWVLQKSFFIYIRWPSAGSFFWWKWIRDSSIPWIRFVCWKSWDRR